jgi:hypothetical protein
MKITRLSSKDAVLSNLEARVEVAVNLPDEYGIIGANIRF